MEPVLRRIFRARQSTPGLERTGGGKDEALPREIDHRINNNMQMVASLLQLQANYIDDPKVLEPFQEVHDRIRAMALVHQKLHRVGAVAQIDFKEYLETLMDLLARAHRNGVNIRPKYEMEPVVLGIDTAIPLGLIAGELICNSLKHAFAGRREGVVRISLCRRDGGRFRLAVADDGCGATEGISKGNSLGLRLVKILTGQIRGQMEYKSENGAEFAIEFKDTFGE